MLNRRRLATLAGLVAIALLGVGAAGCAEQNAAARVGDQTVSQSDFQAELDAWSANKAVVGGDQRGELAHSYKQDFVAGLLQQRIVFMLVKQVFDERGLQLTAADQSAANDQLESQLQGGLDEFPDDIRTSLVDDVARVVKLQRDLGSEGYSAALVNAADDTDISVNSHYGSWDPDKYTVVPPKGPAPAPGSGTTSSGDTSSSDTSSDGASSGG